MNYCNSCWSVALTLLISAAAIADDFANTSDIQADNNVATFDWSQLIQAPPPGALQEQRDSFTSFAEALSAGSYAEAEFAAKKSVEFVVDDATDASYEHARALHNLAIAQQFQGNHESAIQNYQVAVNFIASEEHNLSTSLIMPLRGLAYAYIDSGRIDKAMQIYDQALHVSNVNYGPHALEQLPILNARMDYYFANDNPEAALDILDRISMIYTRKFDQYSEELLPVLNQQAEIYSSLRMNGAERQALRQILAIKEKQFDKSDLELIRPNLRVAANLVKTLRKDTFRAVSTSGAEKHLKRALRIAENSPDTNWKIKVECLLSLADFYTVFDMQGRAHRYYSAAWEMMSSDETYLATRNESFALPVALTQPKPDPYANFVYESGQDGKKEEEYLNGNMTFQFSVDERGRTDNLRLIVANPPNFRHMEKRVINALEEFVYRPRYVDGKAADTGEQEYQVNYFYRESQYQASLKKTYEKSRSYRSRKATSRL